MDPLSDVLALLKPRSYAAGGFNAGGQWSIQFPRNEGIKCYAVVSGECWLSVDDVPEAVRLKAGDCFLLPSGRPFRLGTDMALTPVDAATIYGAKRAGAITSFNGGGDFLVVGSYFALSRNHASMLLGMLPPIVHLRKKSDQETLRWSVERMMQELRDGQPGGFLVAEHLAHMMLVQALRLHLAEGSRGGIGWLFALADKQIGAAINAIHDDPAQRWTLQQLATRVGMSRSSFALKFKTTVGASAMEYLTRWRMLLAEDKLTHSGDPISVIARSLGYKSEAAFSTAFKRVVGCSPRQHSRGRTSVPASQTEGNAARAQHFSTIAG
jgi:AraC-like DNA-binding protein